MAGWLTHLLEGQNLAETQALARDGDLRHLGNIGRNAILMNRFEQNAAENREAARQSEIERVAERAAERAQDERKAAEQYDDDRRRALYLASLRTGADRAAFLQEVPDTDEGVDSFIRSF